MDAGGRVPEVLILRVHGNYYRFTIKDTSQSEEYDYSINLCFQLKEDGDCDKSAVS